MANDLRTWRQLATRHLSIVAPLLAAAGYAESDKAATFQVNPATLEIEYNPAFASKNTAEENAAVLCHEALHVLCDHGKRRRLATTKYSTRFQPHLWVAAEEMAVNSIIAAICSGLKLPKGCIETPDWAVSLTTEDIYEGLCKRATPIKIGCNGNCMPKDGGGDQTAGTAMMVQQAQSNAQKEMQAKGQQPGTMPGELQRIVTGLTAPTAPPKFADLLRRYLVAAQFNCKDFDPTSMYRRRQQMDGICLPNLAMTPGADRFVVSLDASGSVADNQFALFAGTVDVAARQLGFLTMVVQQFTTQVMHTETVTNMEQVKKIARQASGGTCIVDADAKAKKAGGRFHIILTDGYVSWLDRYSIPTLVVVNGDAELPATGAKGLIGAVKLI